MCSMGRMRSFRLLRIVYKYIGMATIVSLSSERVQLSDDLSYVDLNLIEL